VHPTTGSSALTNSCTDGHQHACDQGETNSGAIADAGMDRPSHPRAKGTAALIIGQAIQGARTCRQCVPRESRAIAIAAVTLVVA
jgi:hypothetical protein